ncbi:MAG: ATP-dependent DNA helicase [Patescibacteria group bacterium]
MAKALTTEAFEKAYQKLNPKQREAVDAIEGPVMVVAGPGTGKTQILTLRIANILKETDASPDSILALTFTEAGVAAMRKRLLEIVGSDAYRVPIFTFHGFCNTVISRFPEEFPRIVGAQSVSTVDRIVLMQELLPAVPLSRLRPYGDPLFYTQSALSAISDLKRENISPDRFDLLNKEAEDAFASRDDLYHIKGAHKGKMKGEHQDTHKRIEKNKELALLYRAYEEALRERRLYDYEDMILEVVRALEASDDFRLEIQEEYQYILADEHQDANDSQNRLLELLASFHENPNIFIVGDEKQAIYRFQGASLANFLSFQKHYPEAKLISLIDNYRSSQTILDSAHSVIGKAKEGGELRTRLEAKAPHEDVSVSIVSCETGEAEALVLARAIEKALEEGTPSEEVAVLYRNNRDASLYSRLLAKLGIPYVVESDQNLLEDIDIRRLTLLLAAVEGYGDPVVLLPALSLDYLGFSPLAVYTLFSEVHKDKKNLYEEMQAVPEFTEFAAKLKRWRVRSKNANLLEVVEEIMTESGYLASILAAPDSREKLEKVRTFFAEMQALVESKREADLGALMRHLLVLREHGLTLAKKPAGRAGVVRLMTAHRAKGLEFLCVFIVGAYDGHWGNKRTREQFHLPLAGSDEDGNEDERRLFYVALTRAKKRITISYARQGADGRPQLPSQFIGEIEERYRTEVVPDVSETSVSPEILYGPSQDLPPSLYEKQYLNELFLMQGISATALNAYLACPWRYFYENLIRVPKAQSKAMLYGIAVHASLRIFFDKYREGEDMGKVALVTLFEKYLASQPLREADYQESLLRGREALGGYYDQYKGSWLSNSKNELFISDVILDGEIRLLGAIDKIEFLDSGNKVNIVDYKTGKPKSRNEIAGATKSATGDYLRQLRFYKLLLDRHNDGELEMVSGDIDFIEPDEKGRYHREHFDISSDDVKTLEDLIRSVAEQIKSLAFWDKRCETPECQYCALREGIR